MNSFLDTSVRTLAGELADVDCMKLPFTLPSHVLDKRKCKWESLFSKYSEESSVDDTEIPVYNIGLKECEIEDKISSHDDNCISEQNLAPEDEKENFCNLPHMIADPVSLKDPKEMCNINMSENAVNESKDKHQAICVKLLRVLVEPLLQEELKKSSSLCETRIAENISEDKLQCVDLSEGLKEENEVCSIEFLVAAKDLEKEEAGERLYTSVETPVLSENISTISLKGCNSGKEDQSSSGCGSVLSHVSLNTEDQISPTKYKANEGFRKSPILSLIQNCKEETVNKTRNIDDSGQTESKDIIEKPIHVTSRCKEGINSNMCSETDGVIYTCHPSKKTDCTDAASGKDSNRKDEMLEKIPVTIPVSEYNFKDSGVPLLSADNDLSKCYTSRESSGRRRRRFETMFTRTRVNKVHKEIKCRSSETSPSLGQSCGDEKERRHHDKDNLLVSQSCSELEDETSSHDDNCISQQNLAPEDGKENLCNLPHMITDPVSLKDPKEMCNINMSENAANESKDKHQATCVKLLRVLAEPLLPEKRKESSSLCETRIAENISEDELQCVDDLSETNMCEGLKEENEVYSIEILAAAKDLEKEEAGERLYTSVETPVLSENISTSSLKECNSGKEDQSSSGCGSVFSHASLKSEDQISPSQYKANEGFRKSSILSLIEKCKEETANKTRNIDERGQTESKDIIEKPINVINRHKEGINSNVCSETDGVIYTCHPTKKTDCTDAASGKDSDRKDEMLEKISVPMPVSEYTHKDSGVPLLSAGNDLSKLYTSREGCGRRRRRFETMFTRASVNKVHKEIKCRSSETSPSLGQNCGDEKERRHHDKDNVLVSQSCSGKEDQSSSGGDCVFSHVSLMSEDHISPNKYKVNEVFRKSSILSLIQKCKEEKANKIRNIDERGQTESKDFIENRHKERINSNTCSETKGVIYTCHPSEKTDCTDASSGKVSDRKDEKLEKIPVPMPVSEYTVKDSGVPVLSAGNNSSKMYTPREHFGRRRVRFKTMFTRINKVHNEIKFRNNENTPSLRRSCGEDNERRNHDNANALISQKCSGKESKKSTASECVPLFSNIGTSYKTLISSSGHVEGKTLNKTCDLFKKPNQRGENEMMDDTVLYPKNLGRKDYCTNILNVSQNRSTDVKSHMGLTKSSSRMDKKTECFRNIPITEFDRNKHASEKDLQVRADMISDKNYDHVFKMYNGDLNRTKSSCEKDLKNERNINTNPRKWKWIIVDDESTHSPPRKCSRNEKGKRKEKLLSSMSRESINAGNMIDLSDNKRKKSASSECVALFSDISTSYASRTSSSSDVKGKIPHELFKLPKQVERKEMKNETLLFCENLGEENCFSKTSTKILNNSKCRSNEICSQMKTSEKDEQTEYLKNIHTTKSSRNNGTCEKLLFSAETVCDKNNDSILRISSVDVNKRKMKSEKNYNIESETIVTSSDTRINFKPKRQFVVCSKSINLLSGKSLKNKTTRKLKKSLSLRSWERRDVENIIKPSGLRSVGASASSVRFWDVLRPWPVHDAFSHTSGNPVQEGPMCDCEIERLLKSRFSSFPIIKSDKPKKLRVPETA